MPTPSRIPVLLLAIAVWSLALTDSVAADRFTFARPPAPPSTVDQVDQSGRMALELQRWSSDAERDRVANAIKADGIDKVLSALRDVPRVGTLYWPGGTEYTVHYARQMTRPDGGTDVVLLVDRPLWLWWQSTTPAATHPFTLVQMRLDAAGRGDARASFGVPATPNADAGLVLTDYANAPAVLTDIRRERRES